LVGEGPQWRGAFARRLLGSPDLAGLRVLAVVGGNLSHGAVDVLAGNPAIADLLMLGLLDCTLDRTAGASLAGSEYLRGLRNLVLRGSTIPEPFQAMLRERFGEGAHF